MIGSRVRGAEALAVELRQIAERVADTSRKQLRRGADEIVKEARLNAPVDEGNLEESIRIEREYEPGRGRLKIDVVAGGEVNGVNVEQYALYVHENYSSMQPGPKTLAKQQANPSRIVGEKFLERAAEAEFQRRFRARMIAAIMREVP
ncbi:HK97 gp10 family phage protein [Aureimonas sp. AU40]|uniref:HK97 gp10 family phage protein n=1 Tax=Aureimonas sp. AU40 TaxID=1637747 RepID=UPI0007841B81|nr:HK97 gp10 family phage protein [Aureimonas sp. AU40]